MKVKTKRSFFTIEHPQDKKTKVHCRDLEPLEAMDLMNSFQQYQKVEAILHPNTREPIRNSEGQLETKTIMVIPVSAITNLLSNVIEKWEGLEDEDDNPILYSEDNIKVLFQRELNVTVDGQEETFANYIQSEINKRITAITDSFGKSINNPKKKTSLKRV